MLAFLISISAIAQDFDTPTPVKKSGTLRAAVQTILTGEEIKDPGDGSEENYRFLALSEKRGYARVVGPFEGRADFFLLRGKATDYMIYVDYGCDPACDQKVTLYRLSASSAPAEVPLMTLLELPRFKSVRSKLIALCIGQSGSFDNNLYDRDPSKKNLGECPYVFSFSKTGGDSFLDRIEDRDGTGNRLSVGKSEVAAKVRLTWNGTQFVDSEPDDIDDVFLSDGRMDDLF